jgi:hypothetical protein
MMRQQGRWVVYDVIIESVSLVANYRAQFDRIIRTASIAELLKRMETQVSGQASPMTAPGTGPRPRGGARE